MNITTTITGGVIAMGALTAAASADVVPFTEGFEDGASNWLSGSRGALVEFASGAKDGSAYVGTSADLNSAGPFGLTLFRGEDVEDASGDAFVGDYIAGQITTVSFDFRHDAGQDLGIALRVATSMNFPAFAVELADPVASGVWSTLSFELDFANPLVTLEGPPSPQAFEDIMRSVGNLQISADRPSGLEQPLIVDFDLDNVAITPAPSSLAMLGLGAMVAGRRRR